MVQTIIKKSKYDMGLFAGEDIKHQRLVRDRAIVASFAGKRMTAKQWNKYYTKKGLPSDAGLHFFNYVIYDPTFTKDHTPRWYRLNHSFKPNVKFHKAGTKVLWKTLRNIKKGEELRFNYGDADPSWDTND